MNKKLLPSTLALLMLGLAQAASAASYDCVEVELFQAADASEAASRQDKRAAGIPEDVLAKLRQGILAELPTSLVDYQSVPAGTESCPDPARAVTFGGTVSDYKKGNKAARYFIGFGAGKQKFAVNAWVKDKATGNIIAEDEIVDRKVAGFFGGSADKGVRDFAEKIAKFIGKSLTSSD